MPIHGMFYARFLPREGTKIVAQSPPGCIVPVAVADESGDEESDSDGGPESNGPATAMADSGVGGPGAGLGSLRLGHLSGSVFGGNNGLGGSGGLSGSGKLPRRARGKPLFDFDVMQEFVIPRPAFFNRYLAARDPSGRYAVLGLPVAIRDSKYDRNEFIFNFGVVVDAGEDQGPYERVVRRLASTFAEMERQNEFLSREELREQQERMGGGVGAGAGAGMGGTTPGLGSTPGFAGPGSGPGFAPGFGPGLGSASMPSPPQTSSQSLRRPFLALGTAARAGHSPYHRRSIQSLLEIIKEDLNLYGECMIPVDDANTINMKLFPLHPEPPAVEGWHVPVPKMRLGDAVDPSWDLTLQRVIAHMDGVSDVRRIAYEADVSLELCRAAVRHLLFYDTVLLLDMFFFGSCYAPRPGIHDFIANVGGMVDECARYVCLGGGRSRRRQQQKQQQRVHGSGPGRGQRPGQRPAPGQQGQQQQRRRQRRRRQRNRHQRHPDEDEEEEGDDDEDDEDYDDDDDDNDDDDDGDNEDDDTDGGADDDRDNDEDAPLGDDHPLRVSNFDLIRLMTSFCVGRTVTEWLKGHSDAGFPVLHYVDVRRLVQYGIIKGCLYRVHKYAVSKQYLASLVTGQARRYKPAADTQEDGDGDDGGDDPIQRYTDGQHHFDQIITELNLSEAEILDRLKHLPLPPGDLKILYR